MLEAAKIEVNPHPSEVDDWREEARKECLAWSARLLIPRANRELVNVIQPVLKEWVERGHGAMTWHRYLQVTAILVSVLIVDCHQYFKSVRHSWERHIVACANPGNRRESEEMGRRRYFQRERVVLKGGSVARAIARARLVGAEWPIVQTF